MSSDARWTVGTGVAVVTAIVGTGAVLAGLLLTQMSAVHDRLDRLDDRLDRLDDRLRAVEIGFGKVHQRLLTIERVVLPAPSAPGE